ncbi:MAG: restriction endonuclease subunit S [Bacteroidetes bacterium]|nr:restriction endonuclease subunit S [Bacteroidota bacterium]
MIWDRVNFGEIAEFKNGLNFNKDQYGPGVKYISVADFQEYFSAKTEKLAELKEDFINPSYFLQEGDILFVRSNGNKELVGRNLFIENSEEPLTFSGFCIRARFTQENILPKFFAYLFKSKFFRNTLSANAGGTNINNLNQSILSNLNIPNPPLPTQRRIASILSAYDDLIENNLKRIRLLEAKAFLNYKLIVKSEKLEEYTIEELADVVMGQSPTSNTYTDEIEGLPFHQGVTNFSNYFVEHKIYCKAPIKIAYENDILFSVRAPVGRINFTNEKICIGRGLCALRSKKGVQNYFFHQLKEFFFAEDVIGNGAIFNAVTKVELMKVTLKTPSEKIQSEFEKEAQVIYNLILNLTQQNTKLREARDILLPRLMSGEVMV